MKLSKSRRAEITAIARASITDALAVLKGWNPGMASASSYTPSAVGAKIAAERAKRKKLGTPGAPKASNPSAPKAQAAG